MKKKIIWIGLSVALLLCSYVFFMWLKSYRSPQILGKCIHRVEASIKVVALTFDLAGMQEKFSRASYAKPIRGKTGNIPIFF